MNPFDFIQKLVTRPEEVAASQSDARLAVAAVLVMAARADHAYEDAERATIENVLSARYSLARPDAARLRVEAEAAEEAAMDHYQFTRAIKLAVPYEERVSVLEALWKVVLADAGRDPNEDALMRQLTDRLGLSPMESAQARQRAAAG
jgi:uncharacterized tellurite resistance protein B-like protein